MPNEDAYTRWLGLPPGPRPPTPHQLLGIRPKTTDRAAIDRAAAKRMDRLDQFALSSEPKVREEVQQLMNEVARARTRVIDALPVPPNPRERPVRQNAPNTSRHTRKTKRQPGRPVNVQRRPARAAMPSAATWVLLFFGWVVSIILTAFITSIVVSDESPRPNDEPVFASRDADEPEQSLPIGSETSDPQHPDPGTNPETESGPTPEPAPDPTPDPEPEPEPSPAPAPQPGPDPEPEPTPDAGPEPEPTPRPGPGVDPAPASREARLRAYIQQRDQLDEAAKVELLRQTLSEYNGNIPINLRARIRDGGTIWSITLRGTDGGDPRLTDLSPLTGLQITHLTLTDFPELDSIEPLRGLPLSVLHLSRCPKIADLSPLNDMRLGNLRLQALGVSDLTQLEGNPISHLSISECADLRTLDGLQHFPLKDLACSRVENLEDFAALAHVTPERLSLGLPGVRDVASLNLDGSEIKVLNLRGCEDLTSLRGVEEMPNLQTLYIESLPIPPDEVADLQRRRYRLIIMQ